MIYKYKTNSTKNMHTKVIVAHPAQQHSYHLSRAIKKKGNLFAYITTIYYRKNKLLYRLLNIILDKQNSKRMQNRKYKFIEDETKQFDEILGLIFLLLGRISRNKNFLGRIGSWLGARFGKKVSKLVIKNNVDILICFDMYALTAFEGVSNSNCIKVLDMSSIPAPKICDLIDSQKNLENHANESLKMTRSIFDDQILSKAEAELHLADYFLTASEFTKNKLIEMGINKKKIFIARYGLDIDRYRPVNDTYAKKRKVITFIFVGRMTMVKGFHTLIKALEKLEPGSFKCLLVGHPQNSEALISKLSKDFEYVGPVINDNMPSLYKRADVLIAPSLYDGFGFTVLEAMASGLTVICSKNTGACDLIEDGESGYIINANDSIDLYEKIVSLISNPRKLEDMKRSACKAVESCSWDSYDNSINDIISYIENANHNSFQN